jgi:hypothetical protein
VLVVEVLCELGNALGIGLGLELEALSAEEGLELLVVGDDTIVDDGEFPGGIGSVMFELASILGMLHTHARHKGTEQRTCEDGS